MRLVTIEVGRDLECEQGYAVWLDDVSFLTKVGTKPWAVVLAWTSNLSLSCFESDY